MKALLHHILLVVGIGSLTFRWLPSCSCFAILSLHINRIELHNGSILHRQKLTTDHSFLCMIQPTLLVKGEADDASADLGTRNVRKHFGKQNSSVEQLEWLNQATKSIVTDGSDLKEGKWHQVVSLIGAWSVRAKHDGEAAVRIESLLKLLVDQKRRGNKNIKISIDLYNKLLDSWAIQALFRMTDHPKSASKRAREILVHLQESYESGDDIYPNKTSFSIVLHCVCRVEGALVARRLLAWMEHLCKTGKNIAATPIRSDYIMILGSYANMECSNAAILTEGFIRHMNSLKLQRHSTLTSQDTKVFKAYEALPLPDTYCYNILLKTWNKKIASVPRHGRHIAEQAERILEEMKLQNDERCKPDLITYATVITSWANSGMKSHAINRAEAMLREVENSPDFEVNTIVLNAVMSVWVKSRNQATFTRTGEILVQMEQSDSAKPDLISYNTHLHALSMHASKYPDNARRAKIILQKLEDGFDDGSLSFGPNTFSYNLALDAICRSSNAANTATEAAVVLRRLIQRKNVDPDVYSFNQVLQALSTSPSRQSVSAAGELLSYMKKMFNAGVFPLARPDRDSFCHVIVAYSRCGGKEYAEKGEQLLSEMKTMFAGGDNNMKPTPTCYNALIDCWAKSGEGTLGARKAEALLQEMKDWYDSGEKSMAPTVVTFNAVLKAWANSRTRCCGYKAEQYLERMWRLYHSGDLKLKPDEFSYNTVINAISKSKNQGKAQKALRVLRKMDQLYRAGFIETKPNEIIIHLLSQTTAVISSCAFPAASDLKTRRKALDTAMFTLKELQSSVYGQPNQVTYGTFIRACRNLLKDDENLSRTIIKKALQDCIKDGQFGAMVLNYVPQDLVEELLANYIQAGGSRSNGVPEEWSCNVREKDAWKPRSSSFRKRYAKGNNRKQNG